MAGSKALKVPTLPIAALRRAERLALDKTADQAEGLLQADIRRWDTPVTFYEVSPDEHTRVVGTNSDIYLYNDQPTMAHKIRARRAKRLAFFSRGRWNFPPEVNHPGTKGKYFTKKASDKLTPMLAANLDQAFADAASG